MGTGASAQASEAVQGASVEDMQVAIDQLSDADRAKLKEALAQAQVSMDELSEADRAKFQEALAQALGDGETEAAPAEAKEEAAAPAEAAEAAAEAAAAPGEAPAPAGAAAEGEGAAKVAASSESAPFLAEYFDKLQAREAALCADEENLLKLALDGDDAWLKKFKEESKAWFEKEAKPLLEKSFRHHDTNKTDVLDKDEAAVLFAHVVHADAKFDKVISALSLEAELKLFPKILKHMVEKFTPGEQVDQEVQEECKRHEKLIKQAIEDTKVEIQKNVDNYKANKTTYDVAAFIALDTNGNGTLQLAEFIAGFEPGTELNSLFLIALGCNVKEE